jgi:hypothetical protein
MKLWFLAKQKIATKIVFPFFFFSKLAWLDSLVKINNLMMK